MDIRTMALLIAIVLAFAMWNAVMPKTTGLDDRRECPNLGDGAANVCIRKHG